MRYATLKGFTGKAFRDEAFRHLTGVKCATFARMVTILKEAKKAESIRTKA